ncbi:MAG: acyl-CoA thioesterase [Acidobacteriota bacterium]
MPYEFKLTHRVEFFETDMGGIMHFSNFFRLMESAESAFFRELKHPRSSHKSIGWPRVHAECDYKYPLQFEDEVEIHLLVREKGQKSITFTFIFRKLNETPAREVACGALVAVCVTRDKTSGQMKPVPIPKKIAAGIEAAPREVLDRALPSWGVRRGTRSIPAS